MLAKRKFQNFVNTYGDQSISGKKTFTEKLVVTGECTLPDDTNLNITFDNSSIPESAIVSTTGWIYDAFTELIGSVSDLVNDLTNNTFGFLTSTDTISQNQIDQTTENGWISGMYSGLTAILAPKYSPTFTGEMTFPDGKIISQTTEDTTFWNNVELNGTVSFTNTSTTITDYALKTDGTIDNPYLTGNVTFPDGSMLTPDTETTTFWNDRTLYNTTLINTTTDPWTSNTILDFLTTSTAASTYLTQSSASSTYLTQSSASSTYLTQSSASSTYAPKASPTFTGNINLSGNVTLASAYTNTLTLNDHLILCTGSNFTTPVSGQQGYIMTGTFETDLTTITTAQATKYATLNLTYGVWLILGQIGYYNGNVTSASVSIKWHTISTSVAVSLLYGTRINATNSIGQGIENHETLSRVVTVTSASQAYYLVPYIAYTGGALTTYNSSSYFHAVRIA